MFELKTKTNKTRGYDLNLVSLERALLLFSLTCLIFSTKLFGQDSSQVSLAKDSQLTESQTQNQDVKTLETNTIREVVKIKLESKYSSTHKNIYLKDIASCSGSNICNEIYGILIAQITPQQTLSLNKSKIHSLLSREYKDVDFRIFGNSVEVVGSGHLLTKTDIEPYFKKVLFQKLKSFGNYRVNVDISFLQNTEVFDDNYNISIEGLESDHRMSEQELLKLCLTKTRFELNYNEDDSQSKVIVNARIKLEKELPVALRQIPKNTIITRSDFVTRFTPINYFNLKAISSPQNLIGKKTKYTVYMNKTFSSKNVFIPNLVDKNQIITLRTKGESQGLRMSRSVRAVSSGNKGEVIQVVPVGEKIGSRSNKIQARVVDKLTVETL